MNGRIAFGLAAILFWAASMWAETPAPGQSPYGVNQRHFNCPEVGQCFDELGLRWVRYFLE